MKHSQGHKYILSFDDNEQLKLALHERCEVNREHAFVMEFKEHPVYRVRDDLIDFGRCLFSVHGGRGTIKERRYNKIKQQKNRAVGQ